MVKRRQPADEVPENVDNSRMDTDDDGEEEFEQMDVDFEFFDPQDHDFHGIKNLLRQLFDNDATLLDLSALTDIILSQKLVGSTIKTDGREGDPYAFLTILNLKLHGSNPAVQALVEYIKDRVSGNPLHEKLEAALKAASEGGNVAIVLSERVINIPLELLPPAYKMLLEEIDAAVEDQEPYTFSHYILLSKVYKEVESKLGDDGSSAGGGHKRRPSKKIKAGKGGLGGFGGKNDYYPFHPEDETFVGSSEGHLVYKYKQEAHEGMADSKRAFSDYGILPMGRLILLDNDKFREAVDHLQPSS